MDNQKKLKEGNIYYRKIDNRFMGSFHDSNGKYKYVYDKTYKGCLKKLKDGIAFRDRYLSNIKFYDWLDDWYQMYKLPNVKASTLETIDVAIRVHIKKGICNQPLVKIDGWILQCYLISIVKSRTRKMVHDVLGECFHDALALRLIDYNPMLAVKIPVHHRVKGTALSDKQLQQFLVDIKGHRLEKYFKFLLYTGCRRSEALNLRLSDIDFFARSIHIRGTKTEQSDRYLPLFENVIELFNGMLLKDRVFEFCKDYPTHVFKDFCPEHKLHDLRHTFATKCLEVGVSLKVVQSWLGHSTIDTTADIYSHVTKLLNTQEALKLNGVFKF